MPIKRIKIALFIFAAFLLNPGYIYAADISVSFPNTKNVSESVGSLQLIVSLSRGGEETDIFTLSYATEFSISSQTAATAGADYQSVSSSISWGSDESGSKTISIPISDDLLKESAEVFDIVLNTANSNLTIDSFNTSARYTITIEDNDVVSETPTDDGTPEQGLAQSFNVFCAELGQQEIPPGTQEDKLLDICGGFETATPQETSEALREISPEEVSSMSRIGQQMLNQQLSNIGNRVKTLRQGIKRASLSNFSLSYKGKTLPSYALDNFGSGILGIEDNKLNELIGNPWEWFLSGNFAFGEYEQTKNESGFQPHQYGISTGIDYRFRPHVIGGVALGISGAAAEFSDGNGSISSRGYDLLAYATYFYQDHYFFDAVLSTGSYDFTSKRNINFILAGQTFDKTAKGTTASQQIALNLGAGYSDSLKNGVTYGGTFYINYASNSIDNFKESGADQLNLAIDKQSISNFSSHAGASISKAFSHRWGVFVPQAMLKWIHEFADDTRTISGRFITSSDAASFKFKSDAPDRDYYTLSTSVTWVMAGAKSAFFNYQTLLGRDNYSNHQLALGFRIENMY